MLKKFIFKLLLVIGILPIIVNASVNSLVKVGNNYYDTLEEAIKNASSSDTITLISDVVLDDSLVIDKTINLDLNGNDITAPTKTFIVQGGTLNITGSGTIKETEPNYGAVMVIGSTDANDNDYSVLNVGKDVTLEGWSGIFINHTNSKSYGVVINFEGKIKAVNDSNDDSGIGIYVNGNIKDQSNAPVVNIKDGSEISSSGDGLYIAGYSTFNIGKSYITGIQAGIGIKSGTLNIDGATIICTGEDKTPTDGYNNGINASGAAIQIESNNGYAGDIRLNIKSGKLTSKNSNVIYEYIGRGNTSLVEDINISGGIFTSEASKEVFRVSNSFLDKNNTFISGGKYSSNPNNYLKAGYTSVLDNDMYNVIKSTMKEVNNINDNNSKSKFNLWIIIIGVIIMGILMYLNKNKIIKLFTK